MAEIIFKDRALEIIEEVRKEEKADDMTLDVIRVKILHSSFDIEFKGEE